MSFPVDNIRRACAISGITLAELERELGFGNGTIGKWESAKKAPPYDRLAKIASRLGVSVDDLSDPNYAPWEMASDIAKTKTPTPEGERHQTVEDSLNIRLSNLPPELVIQFARFLQLAQADPEKATRFLAFVNQELDTQK